MSANDPMTLAKHTRKIAHYEGITQGQGQVLLATADALERLAGRVFDRNALRRALKRAGVEGRLLDEAEATVWRALQEGD